MSARNHTPGPWHVDPKAPEESFFEDVNILRHDGLAVAVCVHNGDILPPEPLANAHLVAAAPELLASLKDAIEIIEKHVPRDALGIDHMGDFSVPGGVMTWGVLDEHLHYMRQAIAKASPSTHDMGVVSHG
jgi:hypothetical protein